MRFQFGLVRVTIVALAFACGCNAAPQKPLDAKAELTLEPNPPVVGDSQVALTLIDSSDKPVAGATVRLEGNMNHAGMKPSFADLKESEPGRYAGTLKFTMGGDWFVIVTANTTDGRQFETKIDVPGVKSP